jgi:hypothetical protein
MLFPKVEVREPLLSRSSHKGARVVEFVEIPLDTGKSQRALIALARGANAMRTYRVDIARSAYCDGADFARKDRDGFLEAAGSLLLTQLMDGIGPIHAQTSCLLEAGEILDYEVFQQSERFMEAYTPREQALPIMEPRLALLDLIRYNHAQYWLRGQSAGLMDDKERADQLIALKDGKTAWTLATIGMDTAEKRFGSDHWWVSVMNVRRVLALHILGESEQGRKLAAQTMNALSEWATDGECDPLFAVDYALMKQAAEGSLQLS